MRKNIKLKIKNELVDNKKYFILSCIISTYVFISLFITVTTIKGMIAIVASIVILFIISKISKIIFILFAIMTLLINSAILHIGLHWGNTTIMSRIEVAALSPKSESIEYLMTYLNMIDIFILFYIVIGIFLIYKLLTQLKHSYKIVKVLSLFFLSIVLFILYNLNLIKNVRSYNFIKQYINVVDIEKILERKNYLANLNHDLTNLNNDLHYDKIVIIMGESANKHHMSAYNYSIKTTPFLDTLLENNNSFKYNVIAPTNQTRYSIPITLTSATVDNFNRFFTTKSIITIFKEYGYRTYWLSNQGKVGMHENYIGTIASEADFEKTANLLYVDAKHDAVLIDYLNQINTSDKAKEVYFFHMMGSHNAYKKRYPKNSALFKNPKNVIEEYDNTIFYTDNILEKIYSRFKNSKLLFIYLSDHGEVVNVNKHGHGFFPAYQDEYDIPLIVYSSEVNERLIELQNLNKSSLLNMERFNNFIEYIVGIDTNISHISTSSNVFTLKPNNIIDYNMLNKYQAD